ncbi:hypothetical protein LZG74_19840 [Dyadobacter sp. CY327]|uniref:DAPG hydrolase family protein n=1 Tax=Dyadobacter sp. CY327 TaxID=2907301 RepID=UPI001F3D7F7F|nr:hypothetical protein [Dyadobacter sp. CY327]MCE7072578.1 hypothetical protein [Dyadobacter sp. CY327]
MKLENPLDFGWKMKTLKSAQTDFSITENGVLHLCIKHETLKGITPSMLEWWFRNIGGDMEYKGKTYPKYRVWHPLDHIHWELNKNVHKDRSVGVGSYFRIVEAFGRNPDFAVDSVEMVTKLDDTGIRLVKRIFGLEIFSLEHWFEPAGDCHCAYRSLMIVGYESWFGRFIINPIIRSWIFTDDMGFAWLKHNIEEVGNFEFFLPDLYRSHIGDRMLKVK